MTDTERLEIIFDYLLSDLGIDATDIITDGMTMVNELEAADTLKYAISECLARIYREVEG